MVGIMWIGYAVAIAAIAIAVYIYRLKSYWKTRGVPSYGNVVTGCLTEAFKGKETMAEGLARLYSKTKHEQCVGSYILGKPFLMLNDPEIIKQVLSTDYANFSSHGFFHDPQNDPLSGNIFSLTGQEWKNMRAKMSPTFSSAKIKSMFDIVLSKVEHFERKIHEEESNEIHYNDYMRRLSIDQICACFFGIEANCLDDPNSQFRKISFLFNSPVVGQFVNFLMITNFHKVSKVLSRMKILQSFIKWVNDFIIGLAKNIEESRKKTGEERNDFIDTMIRLKNSSQQDDPKGDSRGKITSETIAAQVFIIFGAGFETTSQANTFALIEMARHPEVMKRAQEECDRILEETGGKITYDALAKMEYMDMIIKETNRLYPALQFLIRAAIRPCKLPSTDIKVEKNTNVWIPLLGLHKDPQYFPNPDTFDPERFSAENKTSIPPYVYMPFGEGPRTCIGMRFALIAIKTVMLTILSKYDVRLTDRTPKDIKFEPWVYFPIPKGNYYLKLIPRNR